MSKNKMKILHTVASYGKQSYGLGSISMGLAKAQLDLGHDVYVWSLDSDDDVRWASEVYNIPKERLYGFPPDIPILNASISQLKSARSQKNIDIVHQHSLWTSQSLITTILRKKGAKTCIAAHGTLSEFALEKSKFKKKLALKLFEGSNLNHSNVLHATSEYEIEDFRRLGLTNPIAYIENGIGSHVFKFKGNGTYFKKKYQLPEDKKVLLYLSRITPKKGLDMLIPVIAELKDKFQDWILIIVGNDEFNYQQKVETMVHTLNLTDKVFFIEPQYGNGKFDVFDASDFFILPSYSEGSPMVVLDALAYGLPVITTESSSWKDLNTHEAGFWVEISTNGIKTALQNMLDLSAEQRNQYSENAKKIIQEKYLWEKISQKTLEMYQWMLYSDSKPHFIY